MSDASPPRRPASLIATPVFLLAVATLLLNDHVLKDAWPGFVTGKLSDVAGVAMMAILLSALAGRSSIGFVATAVGFTLLKTVSLAAILAAPILGGVTRTDPTDVLALFVLIPLWIWARRPPQAGRCDRRSWVVAVQVVAVSTAVFATTATSCGESGVFGLERDADGTIEARGASAVSADGGITWARSYPLEFVDSGDATDDESCIEGRCYTLVRQQGGDVWLVERTGDVERTLFVADGDAIDRLDALDPPSCYADPFGGVAAVEVDDGRHVVVAMGWLGVIHVGPDETAEWVAVDGFGVQQVDASDRPLGIDVASSIGTQGFGFALPRRAVALMFVAAPLLPFIALPIVIAMAKRRHRKFGGAVWGCVAGGLLLGVVSAVIGLSLVVGAQGRGISAAAIVVFGLGLLASVPWLMWHARSADSPPPAARPPYPTATPTLGRPNLPPPDPRDRRS